MWKMNYTRIGIKTLLFLLFIFMLANSLHYYNVIGFPFGKSDLRNYLGILWISSDLVHIFFITIAKTFALFFGEHPFFIYMPVLMAFLVYPYHAYTKISPKFAFYFIFGTSITIWFYVVALYCQCISMLFFWIVLYYWEKENKIKWVYVILSLLFHYYTIIPYTIILIYKLFSFLNLSKKDAFLFCTFSFLISVWLTNFNYSLFVSRWDIFILYYYHINPILIVLFYMNRKDFYNQWSFMFVVGMFALNSRVVLYALPVMVYYALKEIEKLPKESQYFIMYIILVYYMWIFTYQIEALIEEAGTEKFINYELIKTLLTPIIGSS